MTESKDKCSDFNYCSLALGVACNEGTSFGIWRVCSDRGRSKHKVSFEQTTVTLFTICYKTCHKAVYFIHGNTVIASCISDPGLSIR